MSDLLNNNFGKEIPYLLSNFVMITGLAYLAYTKTLFNKDSDKSQIIQNISELLFTFFLLYGITNVFKFSKNKNLMNIIFSFLLIVFLLYLMHGKNIFHEKMKYENIINTFLKISFMYVFVWVFLHMLKSQFASSNITGTIPKTWNKVGLVFLFVCLYISLLIMGFGNVYHEDVSQKKKIMSAMIGTSLFSASLVILTFNMKK